MSTTRAKRKIGRQRPGSFTELLLGTKLFLHPDDSDEKLLGYIKTLTPSQFEYFCRLLWERIGYTDVQVQGRAGDGGVDLIMRKGDKLVIAQCKRYQSNVGAPVLHGFYGTLTHHEATYGFFITTSDFTPSARHWVQGKPIELINAKELAQRVRKHLLTDIVQSSEG